MIKMKRFCCLIAILIIATAASAVNLFEIKDEVGNPVLVVSTDGLRILNGLDTLMVISTSEIRANIKEDENKALSRTFSVSTTSAKGSQGNIMNVTTDGLDIVGQSSSKALGDTLMTISSKKISARIPSSTGKEPSRTFSVITTSAKGAMNALEVGTDSTKIGTDATTMGQYATRYTDFSPENIFLGLHAGGSNETGIDNTFLGNQAGISNSTGVNNSFIGKNAGYSNTLGADNVCLGSNAGYTNTIGNNNVIIGKDSGKYYSGSFGNVFIGEEAAMNLTSGQRNVMIGYYAGAQPLSTFTSYGNVFLGGAAGRKVSGDHNVMIGEAAGENYQEGGSTGYGNVFVGWNAGQHSTGNGNIYIGESAGKGESTNVHAGSNNIYIGNSAGWADVTESNTFRLGHLMWGDLDGPMMLVVNGEGTDNTNGRIFFSNGSAGGTTVWNNDSDERLKKNISTIDGALERVMKLRGVTYEWKDVEKYEKGRRMGFIAQESKDIIPEAVDYDATNDRYTMQYSTVTALLVEAVKDLKKQVDFNVAALGAKESENKKIIDGQNEKIGMLIKENSDLKKKVDELESLRAEIDKIKNQLAGYSSR